MKYILGFVNHFGENMFLSRLPNGNVGRGMKKCLGALSPTQAKLFDSETITDEEQKRVDALMEQDYSPYKVIEII